MPKCYCICGCRGPRVGAVRSALIQSAERFQRCRNRIWFSCSEMGLGCGGVRLPESLWDPDWKEGNNPDPTHPFSIHFLPFTFHHIELPIQLSPIDLIDSPIPIIHEQRPTITLTLTLIPYVITAIDSFLSLCRRTLVTFVNNLKRVYLDWPEYKNGKNWKESFTSWKWL